MTYLPENSENRTYVALLELAHFSEKDVSSEKRDKDGKWTKNAANLIQSESSKEPYTPEQDAFFKSYDSEWETVTPKEKSVLDYYVGNGFAHMNRASKALMNGTDADPYHVKTLKVLDDTIDKFHLKSDVILRRGLNLSVADVDNLRVGQIFSERGYASTTVGKPFGGSVTMVINAPKGSKAFPVGHYGKHTDREVILPRYSKYLITSITVEKDWPGFGEKRAVMHVDLLPEKP